MLLELILSNLELFRDRFGFQILLHLLLEDLKLPLVLLGIKSLLISFSVKLIRVELFVVLLLAGLGSGGLIAVGGHGSVKFLVLVNDCVKIINFLNSRSL